MGDGRETVWRSREVIERESKRAIERAVLQVEGGKRVNGCVGDREAGNRTQRDGEGGVNKGSALNQHCVPP